jgi:prophage regulatory protein
MIAAVKAVGREGHREMTFDRISPRRAFTMMCEAQCVFGDETAKQCFNATRAASQDSLDVVNAFTAGVADGRIPIYGPIHDEVIGERRFQICPQEELIETFVILMAEEANHDPWPSSPPAPLYTIDRSDVEQFISIWLKENGLDDMRLDGAPRRPLGTAKDACRPPTDIHLDQNMILSAAPAIERQLLRLSEVKRLTGLSKSGIYARMKDADFPKQKNLGPQTVAWWSDEVAQWISSRT